MPSDLSTREAPVLVIGEALTDILAGPDGTRRCCPGGSPANVALGLARLGHPVRLATRVGRDLFGDALRDRLRASGVALTEGSVADGPTSTATARLDADGVASYDFDIFWDLPPAAVEPARTGAAAHLHTGSIAATLAPGADRVLAAVEAARGGATVSYDPNLRPALLGTPARERPRVERLVSISDVVKASQEDLAWLYPGQDVHEVALRWSRSGPSLVVVTLGAGGARVWWRHGRRDLPATPVEVTDTVGAGDAFMAGLISGMLRAGMLGASSEAGVAAGAGAAVGAGEGTAATGGEPDEPGARTALRRATTTGRLDQELERALVLAGRAAAFTCTREGADPPTRAEISGWSPR